MNNILFYGDTNVGRVRDNNEDAFITTALWDKRHALLAAIDGLGGYEGGEVAAAIARDTITSSLEHSRGGDCLTLLKEAVTRANNAIVEHKTAHSEHAQMGCVLTAAIVELRKDNIVLYTVHVGDTRLYSYRHGTLEKITHDHSLVGYREEIGELTEEEAMNHPRRNLVDRVVGEDKRTPDDRNFIEASVRSLEPGTQLLFCSDGLTDLVTSAEIKRVLTRDDDTLKHKCQNLINLALEHGGRDNVTVVLAAIEGETRNATTADDDTNEVTEPAKTDPEKPAKRHSRAPLVIAALVTLTVLGAIAYYFLKRGNAEPMPKPVTTPVVVDTVTVSDSVPAIVDSVALRADSLQRELEATQHQRDSLDAKMQDIQNQILQLNNSVQR